MLKSSSKDTYKSMKYLQAEIIHKRLSLKEFQEGIFSEGELFTGNYFGVVVVGGIIQG